MSDDKSKELKHNKNNITIQQRAKKLLIGFFILMLLFTVLSRAADSLTVAQVTISEPKQGGLVHLVSGSGTVEPRGNKSVSTIEGIKVEEIHIEVGQNVKKGDAMLTLNTEDIEQQLLEAETTVKKLNIQLEQDKLNTIGYDEKSVDDARVSLKGAEDDLIAVSESADREISSAQTDLVRAENDFEKSKADYDEAMQKLKEDMTKNSDEKFEDAQTEYDSVKLTNEELIAKAQRVVKDFIKISDKLEEGADPTKVKRAVDELNSAYDSGDENRIATASKALDDIIYGDGGATGHEDAKDEASLNVKRAKEDLEAITAKCEIDLQKAQVKLDRIIEDIEKVKNGTYEYENDLKAEQQEVDNAKKEVEDKQRNLDDRIFDKETKLNEAQRVIDKAKLSLESTEKKDLNAVNEFQNQKKITELKLKNTQLDIELKNSQIKKLTEISNSNGIIYSDIDGTVVKISAEVGKRTSNEEVFLIARSESGFQVRCLIDDEQGKYIVQGDEMKIEFAGKKAASTATVVNINFKATDKQVEIIMELSDGDYKIGETVEVSMEKRTDNYNICIPIRGLRSSQEGDYVLLIKEVDTILGKESKAYRLDVNVIDKDNKTAAIEGGLGYGDKVIIESSKNISEGDRVRIK